MVFARCRFSLSHTLSSSSSTGSWLEASQVYFRRFRSSSRKKTSYDKFRSLKLSHYDTTRQRSRPDFSRPRRTTFVGKKPHELDDVAVSNANDAILAIEAKVDQWALLPHVQHRMLSFGIPRRDLAELLGSFLYDVRDGMLSNEHRLADLGFGWFILTPAEMSSGRCVDQVISQLFFVWASHPTTQNTLRKRLHVHAKRRLPERILHLTGMQVSFNEQTVRSPEIVYFRVHADEMAALGVVSTVDDLGARTACVVS
ncbi:hypothetical protein BKA83DRAFT_1149345 [Pisolithus microcarpus]|nr:hypothetical protein BKA83DRAFT_1149345 [Pisolithus microcarpus]